MFPESTPGLGNFYKGAAYIGKDGQGTGAAPHGVSRRAGRLTGVTLQLTETGFADH